jgi:DNA-directed RNA polymerase subunit H
LESTLTPITHVNVPVHKLATDQEVKALLDSLNCTIEQIPVIYSTDPAIATLNARIGDVVKIERVSPITEKPSPYYRLVVEAEE